MNAISDIDKCRKLANRLNDVRLQVAFLAGTLMTLLERYDTHESHSLGSWTFGYKLADEIGEIISEIKPKD